MTLEALCGVFHVMSSSRLSLRLQRLREIGLEASQRIMEIYSSEDFETETKGDGSPLTKADRASHTIISSRLTAWEPSIPVLSEEGEIPPYEERQSWKRFWLVDPLDGTKEFLARNGQFTVNIALIENGVPVAGLISAPALDTIYLGEQEQGAWKEGPDQALTRIYSSTVDSHSGRVVIESRSHKATPPRDVMKDYKVVKRVAVGSALKFGWLAEGKADLYPRFVPCMEWDVAAGDCIFSNSAKVGKNSTPFEYNTKSLKIENFVISA